ncbi:hypothetical protein KFK09_019017 [Dendrobium nobile]|uniref:Uncharacterized protein n=1 Tax=Dendrobium nobile TaxID=94219 RepID=A0A8T3AXF0_DENNO|nr:hypothetical protein KFK09_019017 [Dendrobium nobile]
MGDVDGDECSEAVREGFEAEKRASQREQRNLTAFGGPESEVRIKTGSAFAAISSSTAAGVVSMAGVDDDTAFAVAMRLQLSFKLGYYFPSIKITP